MYFVLRLGTRRLSPRFSKMILEYIFATVIGSLDYIMSKNTGVYAHDIFRLVLQVKTPVLGVQGENIRGNITGS